MYYNNIFAILQIIANTNRGKASIRARQELEKIKEIYIIKGDLS